MSRFACTVKANGKWKSMEPMVSVESDVNSIFLLIPIFMKLSQRNWHYQVWQMQKYSPIYSNKHAEPSKRSREMVRRLGLKKRYVSSAWASNLLGEGASTQSGSWLPETLWVKQKVETEVWLPQAFTVRKRYVSCEIVTWFITHSS